ncbi:flagellar hook-length control protein FliK [Oceanicoccus sagamiensis]|uniref:Flagellar hook-length control protein-like C-terminal domain-containing protein n=1 Tax=Oceanicoccus sagamiensis TaxID=716816 RepID=A0A1X9NKQ2_9GAMM|nr:flagellar hook-length control protein FliK [Oceanicoccus sagamiensis]ARN75417.1 hypothetical protein BST96_15635 [Oceanicoccus sagamiensis]
MNSTGQNLGVNPLMGVTDTVASSEAAKSVSTLPADDKSLKNQGFSDIMDGQQEPAQPALTTAAEPSAEELAALELANINEVFSTAPASPKTLFAADSGSPLPVDGRSLPSGETAKVVTPAIAAATAAVEPDIPLTTGVNTPAMADTPAPPNPAAVAATTESRPLQAGAQTNDAVKPAVVDTPSGLNPTAELTAAPVAAATATPQVTTAAAVAPVVAANTNTAKADVTKTPAGLNHGLAAAAGKPATVNASGIAVPVVPAEPVITATVASASVEATTEGVKSATLSSLQESPLGLRIKPQMTNNPSGIATIETAFTEAKEASAPAASAVGSLLGAEAPQAYRSSSETSLQTAVAVPVGKPGWSEGVMQRVMWMSAQNISKAEIALDPPELGPMNVKISTSGDQTSVVFTSNHGAVRDALDQGLPRLREMMENQGVNLSDVDVSDQSASQQREQANAEEASGEKGSDGELADGADRAEGDTVLASKPLSLVDQYV